MGFAKVKPVSVIYLLVISLQQNFFFHIAFKMVPTF